MYSATSSGSTGLAATMLVTICLGSAASTAAEAAPIFYDSRAAFDAAIGTSITDTYDDYGNGNGNLIFTDIQMNSVFGQTRYTPTENPNLNIVGLVISGFLGNPAYCAGCNGSFTLDFMHTTIGSSKGVYGVAFDFVNLGNLGVPPYTAFITFGDGSTLNEPIPAEGGLVGGGIQLPPGFFGVTSDSLISSIALGLPNGEPTGFGFFAEDNLTIAGPPAVPEPTSIALIATAL